MKVVGSMVNSDSEQIFPQIVMTDRIKKFKEQRRSEKNIIPQKEYVQLKQRLVKMIKNGHHRDQQSS